MQVTVEFILTKSQIFVVFPLTNFLILHFLELMVQFVFYVQQIIEFFLGHTPITYEVFYQGKTNNLVEFTIPIITCCFVYKLTLTPHKKHPIETCFSSFNLPHTQPHKSLP